MGRKKPGPTTERRNPDPLPDVWDEVHSPCGRIESVLLPLSEWTAWLAVEEIDATERALRKSFKARRRDHKCRPEETPGAATRRIAGLVREVAEEPDDSRYSRPR